MAVETIYWGDGSPDAITVTFTGTSGNSAMSVESDPNITGSFRTKVISFKTTGVELATLTVNQKSHIIYNGVEYYSGNVNY